MEDWDTDWEDGEERAKWITERAGVFADRDIAKIDIGEVKDGMLHVREEYGGGVISLKKARKIVNEHMYAGNLAGSPTMQKRIKEAFAGRGIECECNLLSEAAKGGAQGIAEGATVEVDYATLGWVPSLHKKSLEIQADAANNGDVLSQIGFGLGKGGIEVGYTVVGLKAGSLVGRGAARVAPRLMSTLNKAKPVLQGVGIVTGTADTVGYTYCSYEAFRAGDYNTGAHMLSRGTLSGILTGALIKDTFGSSKPTSKQTGSYTNRHESGNRYHGKGPQSRAQRTANQIARQYDDPHVSTDWTPAANDREAFIDEAWRIYHDDGVKNPDNYNKINSPGYKFIKHLLGEG